MKKNWNWMLLTGSVLALGSFFSYFMVFAIWPVTRDFPWINLPLSAIALVLLGTGLWRAYGEPEQYRGKIYGPLLAVPAVAFTGLLCFYIFYLSYQLPGAAGAPTVGDRMPNISLTEQSGDAFQLSQLIPAVSTQQQQDEGSGEAAPEATNNKNGKNDKWVLLVFYRGYW